MDPFVAEIRIFPFNFAPRGWAWCDGQLIPLSQNTALFSLLGTTYGGNGRSNFALPDLRGRAPMGPGEGPGLTYRELGESGGDATVTLVEAELPPHSHALTAATTAAETAVPSSTVGLAPSSGGGLYQNAADTALAADALGRSGQDAPHNNLQPYLTCYFAIALQGVFPPRS